MVEPKNRICHEEQKMLRQETEHSVDWIECVKKAGIEEYWR